MLYRKITWANIICFFILSSVWAQEKLEIVHADSLKGINTPQGITRLLIGNVHLRQGTTELFCQHVTWYVDQHETILERDVKFTDGEKTLTSMKVFYNDQTRTLRALGEVVVVDSLHKLTAERTIYNESEERIIAEDNVVLTDSKNEVMIQGEYAEYWRDIEYAFVTGYPVLTKRDSTENEEVRITSKKMELFEGGQRAIASDSVKIDHQGGYAESNRAEYFKNDNRMLLMDNPSVTQRHDRLAGEEIELFFDNKKLHRVVIKGQAVVTTPMDTLNVMSYINKVFGDTITLFIEEDVLQQVCVEGKATSYYHIREENEYKGQNKIVGDKITMYLTRGEIQRIIIESDPETSSGIYYPPNFKKHEYELFK